MGAVISSGLLLFKLSGVRLEFLTRNPRVQVTVSISLIRLIRLILPVDGIMEFTICMPPVIPGLQGPKQINTLLGRDGTVVVIKLPLDLFLHHFSKSVFKYLADNIILVGNVPDVPS